MAVLVRAIEDIITPHRLSSEEQRTALWWIKNWKDFDSKRPFTFPWVCEHLDLDPYEMRKNILGSPKIRVHIKKFKYSYTTRLARAIVNEEVNFFHTPCSLFLTGRK